MNRDDFDETCQAVFRFMSRLGIVLIGLYCLVCPSLLRGIVFPIWWLAFCIIVDWQLRYWAKVPKIWGFRIGRVAWSASDGLDDGWID